MTQPVNQFLGILRGFNEQRRGQPQVRLNLYCENCGKDNPHTVTPAGEWETFTCTGCGHQEAYRVG